MDIQEVMKKMANWVEQQQKLNGIQDAIMITLIEQVRVLSIEC